MSMFTAYSPKRSTNNRIQLPTIFRARIVVLPPFSPIPFSRGTPNILRHSFATDLCTTFWRFFFGTQTLHCDMIRIFTSHCIVYVNWCCLITWLDIIWISPTIYSHLVWDAVTMFYYPFKIYVFNIRCGRTTIKPILCKRPVCLNVGEKMPQTGSEISGFHHPRMIPITIASIFLFSGAPAVSAPSPIFVSANKLFITSLIVKVTAQYRVCQRSLLRNSRWKYVE